MTFWLWTAIGILIIIVFFLTVKIALLKKAAREIGDGFANRIAEDSNILIDTGSHDRDMKRLAKDINIQLKKLRSDRLRYQQGDWELKDTVTNISHDLRTPLTAICGYLDLLDDEEKSENAARYLRIIRGRTEILRQLSEELFRYSVFTSVSKGTKNEPVVLNRIVEDSVSGFYAALKSRGITPRIHMPESKVCRMLNRNAISRIFGNLIGNALKYSDGDLIIELKDTGEILFSNHASALDEIQTGRLFDRFYTVETASADSTGLGLSIARALTEQMGGKIGAVYEEEMLKVRVEFPGPQEPTTS